MALNVPRRVAGHKRMRVHGVNLHLAGPSCPVAGASLESPSAAGGVRVGLLPAHHLSEAIMKAILSAALVLGLCGLSGAREAKADPVGTWKCEYEIGNQKRMSTLTIKKDGDKLVGTMSWPEQKDEKLKDVKLKDGTLTFSAERKVMDNKFNVEYKLMIDGDKLKGKGAVQAGGEKREFDITGSREKTKDK
jgi:hypothetical protein